MLSPSSHSSSSKGFASDFPLPFLKQKNHFKFQNYKTLWKNPHNGRVPTASLLWTWTGGVAFTFGWWWILFGDNTRWRRVSVQWWRIVRVVGCRHWRRRYFRIGIVVTIRNVVLRSQRHILGWRRWVILKEINETVDNLPILKPETTPKEIGRRKRGDSFIDRNKYVFVK